MAFHQSQWLKSGNHLLSVFLVTDSKIFPMRYISEENIGQEQQQSILRIQADPGQTQRSVADAVGVARSIVARLWNRFQETGNVRRRPGAGWPRATTATDDRYIQLTARRNRTECYAAAKTVAL
ncbi:hypothetical protein TNCV_1195201 [Trichonephila clavipes]|nr:hypothetical protein TNCV_1195201 [Trichonephila clavipes]